MTACPVVPVRSPSADGSGATEALAQSRERWRDLARMAFDLSFETDADGRFTLLSPDRAFGWPTQALLGLPAAGLFAQPPGVTGLDPLGSSAPQGPAYQGPVSLRRHRAWLRRADGSVAGVLLSCDVMRDRDGLPAGVRGAIEDVSERDAQEQRLADILLCQQTLREINRRMRRAVLPDTVIGIGLNELLDATGSNGGLLVACEPVPPRAAAAGPGEPTAPGSSPRILQRVGSRLPVPDDTLIAQALEIAAGQPTSWTRTETRHGHELILCATATRFSDPVVLVLWREAGRNWLDGDPELVAAFLMTLGSVLEHDQMQRELARHSGADTLTGLLNRDSFVTEVGRRLDRLDAEGLAATLMVVGLDRFREINERNGPEIGDDVLRQAAHLLRDAVRPTDLVARLGGDMFALWLDGADQFAAAERAETMCQGGITATLGEPTTEPVVLRVSVGLATRPCRSLDGIDTLLDQAHAALGAIKLAGGGRWHFYNEDTGA